MPKNILISALGAQPIIIKETIGYRNYCKHNDYYTCSSFYDSICKSRKQFKIEPVDELWLIATDKKTSTSNSRGAIQMGFITANIQWI